MCLYSFPSLSESCSWWSVPKCYVVLIVIWLIISVNIWKRWEPNSFSQLVLFSILYPSPLNRVELRNWMIMSYSFIMKISIHTNHLYLVLLCSHDLERSFQHGHASNRSLCRYPFKDWWLFHSNGGIELSECRCQNSSSHSSCVYIQWGIRNHANLNSKHLLYWWCPLQQRRINTCMKLFESSHWN